MPDATVHRREFLRGAGAVVALSAVALPSFCRASECADKNAKTEQAAVDDRHPQEQKTEPHEIALPRALEFLNPTLVEAVTGTVTEFCGVWHLIGQNLKQFEAGALSTDELIYNSADKYSGAIVGAITDFLPYLLRLSVVDVPSTQLEDEQRASLSAASTITAFHINTAVFTYIYNPLQALLREHIMTMLQTNRSYGYDPRKIPLTQLSKAVEKDCELCADSERASLNFLKRIGGVFTSVDNSVPVPEAIERDLKQLVSKRGLLDILLVTLSYPATMKVNFGLGKAVALPHRMAMYSRDMIDRLKRSDAPQCQVDEELRTNLAYYCNGTVTALTHGLFQEIFERSVGSEDRQRNRVAYTNLRELVGTISTGALFYLLQGKIEKQLRRSAKSGEQSTFELLGGAYLHP